MVDADINIAALTGGVTGSLMTILYDLTFAFFLFLLPQYCFQSQLDKDLSTTLKSEKRPIRVIIRRFQTCYQTPLQSQFKHKKIYL